MKFSFFYLTLFICSLVLSCSNSPEEKYASWVAEELESDQRIDTLHRGYHFGMQRKAFFDYSWSLNQEGSILGSTNMIIEDVDFLKAEAQMAYYPKFKDDKIYQLPFTYQYKAWAPWNKKFWGDSMAVDLLKHYQTQYGEEFMKLPNKEKNRWEWVHVQRNLETRIYRESDMAAKVVFTDLSVTQAE